MCEKFLILVTKVSFILILFFLFHELFIVDFGLCVLSEFSQLPRLGSSCLSCFFKGSQTAISCLLYKIVIFCLIMKKSYDMAWKNFFPAAILIRSQLIHCVSHRFVSFTIFICNQKLDWIFELSRAPICKTFFRKVDLNIFIAFFNFLIGSLSFSEIIVLRGCVKKIFDCLLVGCKKIFIFANIRIDWILMVFPWIHKFVNLFWVHWSESSINKLFVRNLVIAWLCFP